MYIFHDYVTDFSIHTLFQTQLLNTHIDCAVCKCKSVFVFISRMHSNVKIKKVLCRTQTAQAFLIFC